MINIQSAQPRFMPGQMEPTGHFPSGGSRRWVRMWSSLAVGICVTGSMSEVAKSCVTQDSRSAYMDDRWKRYLSLVSHAASLSG